MMTRWRLRCPSCGDTQFFDAVEDARARQKIACRECNVGRGVSEVEVTVSPSGNLVEVAADGGQSVAGPDSEHSSERVDPADLRADLGVLRASVSSFRADAAAEENARLAGHLSLASDSVADAVYHTRKYLEARDDLAESSELVTDGGWVDDHPDAEWCGDCGAADWEVV